MGGGHVIEVQEWFAERAAREISLYFEENQPDGSAPALPDLRPVGGLESVLTGLALLLAFYAAYHRVYPGLGAYPERWGRAGQRGRSGHPGR